MLPERALPLELRPMRSARSARLARRDGPLVAVRSPILRCCCCARLRPAGRIGRFCAPRPRAARAQRSAYELARGRARVDCWRLPCHRSRSRWTRSSSSSCRGIVRRYLEDRFQLRSPELTTEEFLEQMASRLSGPVGADMQELAEATSLRRADLVKFAAPRSPHPSRSMRRVADGGESLPRGDGADPRRRLQTGLRSPPRSRMCLTSSSATHSFSSGLLARAPGRTWLVRRGCPRSSPTRA